MQKSTVAATGQVLLGVVQTEWLLLRHTRRTLRPHSTSLWATLCAMTILTSTISFTFAAAADASLHLRVARQAAEEQPDSTAAEPEAEMEKTEGESESPVSLSAILVRPFQFHHHMFSNSEYIPYIKAGRCSTGFIFVQHMRGFLVSFAIWKFTFCPHLDKCHRQS